LRCSSLIASSIQLVIIGFLSGARAKN